jgi:hypothetical protein
MQNNPEQYERQENCVESDTQHHAPKPLTTSVEGCFRTAKFNREQLKRFAEETTAQSFVVQDTAGNFIGRAHISLIRELFSEQGEDTIPTASQVPRQSQNQPCPNA